MIDPRISRAEAHWSTHGVHAQNYHIFTPPGDKDWAMAWGCAQYIKQQIAPDLDEKTHLLSSSLSLRPQNHFDGATQQFGRRYEDFDAEAAADTLKDAGFQMVSSFAVCNAGYSYYQPHWILGTAHPNRRH